MEDLEYIGLKQKIKNYRLNIILPKIETNRQIYEKKKIEIIIITHIANQRERVNNIFASILQ